jgi:hypothetical protein
MDAGVIYLVTKLVWEMKPNPFTQHAPTVQDVIDIVRRAYGDEAADAVKITVH